MLRLQQKPGVLGMKKYDLCIKTPTHRLNKLSVKVLRTWTLHVVFDFLHPMACFKPSHMHTRARVTHCCCGVRVGVS